ncbi:hypothetical protein [Nannocystis radixulma]|uniref:Uncharacterized protein n=1 Tax=Nannocystis radixulma TaxID=2995305 RepID=A0ABT5BM11_9BACT|nr:hypothetical protein [Nannocystis radixulma]MDC0673986.1 hypothetical protein [Nannocystis radixulma]
MPAFLHDPRLPAPASERRYVRAVASLAGAALALSAPAASAAPPAAEDVAYRDLQRRTGLDLSRAWTSYHRGGETRPFADHVERWFRARRDIGRSFVVAGGALVVVGGFFIAFGASGTEGARSSEINWTVGAATMAAAGVLLVTGGALWGVYFRRLERLEAATMVRGGRLRLRAAAPLVLPQGGGLSVRVAF